MPDENEKAPPAANRNGADESESERTLLGLATSSQGDSEARPAFIHSALDDAGLSACQFRVYCHIARRAGSNSSAFASVRSMAATCCMDIKTVRAALAFLVRYRFLARQSRKGTTAQFRLTPQSEWIPLPKSTTPTLHHTQNPPIPNGTHGSYQNPPGDPSQNPPPKYIPLSTSLKEIPLTLLPGADDAEMIYREYPRKKDRPKALKAILKALKSTPFHELMEKTKAFATLWRGHDTGFCKYPATWFNGEYYNEDPETWDKPNENNHTQTRRGAPPRDYAGGFAGPNA